ncbi:MAG: hypothetical protein ACTS5I_13685 [Rhodanobacter sp.]
MNAHAAAQGLAEALQRIADPRQSYRQCREIARAALAAWNARDVAESVVYGCHCDIESTVSGKPDSCVFDSGDIEDCIYATKLHKEGKTQTDCRYWKPIAIVAAQVASPVAWMCMGSVFIYKQDAITAQHYDNGNYPIIPLYASTKEPK